MKERRRARRLALDALYQAEIRDQLPTEAWDLQREQIWLEDEEAPTAGGPSEEAQSYATKLVTGVEEHAAQIDEVIARCADRWALDRMAVLDKSLLRIAMFELLWLRDVPVSVVINEAIELGKALSTEGSGAFINGILGRAASDRPEQGARESTD